jgi:hypothetical protein
VVKSGDAGVTRILEEDSDFSRAFKELVEGVEKTLAPGEVPGRAEGAAG